VGNLASTALPNGVAVTPSVDQMNRVTDLLTARQAAGGGTVSAYSYLYGPVGNRTYAAGSAGGPSVSSTYGYDSIYRLTQESVASAGVQADNGALTYGLDAVGNRQSLTSTLAAIATQPAMSYNANDRLTANSYDANGNTLGAGGKTFAYDSQDRLTSFNGGAVTMVYDGDGNRVSKTAGGATTVYLVDDGNPTGLPQVAEELSSGGVVQKRYVYGLARIGQTQVATAATSFYGYDGHGDVRYLMDVTGAVTDTYDYDAFGNVVGSTGTTANVYRYQGEAFDTETGLYYLRARYYDPVPGRFLSVDPMADQGQHPYTYAGADPVNGHDPTGQETVIMYSMLTAVFTPSVAVMVGMREDIKCIFSLTGSILANPGFMIGRVAGCVAMFAFQEPSTPKPGGPSDPDKPCKCGYAQCCKFIREHQDDASRIAEQISNTKENVLALSAYESGWGSGHFAAVGAFFNLESRTKNPRGPLPPPFANSTGWEAAPTPNAQGFYALVAKYSSYGDSADSFAKYKGHLFKDKTSADEFGRIAHANGFGIDPGTFLGVHALVENCER